MERLIGAILLKAIEDWSDSKRRPEIEEFLESDWFNSLVELVNLEPTKVRDQLRKENYHRVSFRAAYR